MAVNRRRFLADGAKALAAGAGLLAAAGPARAAAGGVYEGDIIDTHQHLWDLSQLRLPWLSGELKRDYVSKDYAEAVRGLRVVKAVYMEVAVAVEDQAKEARLVLDLCRGGKTPTVAAVIGGRLESDDFAAYIEPLRADKHLKGVRQIVPTPGGRPALYADKTFIANIRRLGEWGLSFDLCPPPQGLGDALALVQACPGTRFIVDHCGNADPNAFAPNTDKTSHSPDQWRRDMGRLAGQKNVICKISGIVARMSRGNWRPADLAPVISHCLDSFGPDRCVFASDWPVCTKGASLAEWVSALKVVVASRPANEQKKLFHDNAAKFYGLL